MKWSVLFCLPLKESRAASIRQLVSWKPAGASWQAKFGEKQQPRKDK